MRPNDVAVRYRSARGPPRRVRFQARADGRYQRVRELWNGCRWVPTGRALATDVAIEGAPETLVDLVEDPDLEADALAGDQVAVDRRALADVIEWTLSDAALDFAVRSDQIIRALVELADALYGPLCEACVTPRAATERCADGTMLCDEHAAAVPPEPEADD